MIIITDHKVAPKPLLLVIAAIGWAFLVYIAFVVLKDSIDRTGFAIAALQGQVPAEINPFIDRYTAHPWQTLAHCATGALFAVLGPLQFVAPLRRRFPLVHRISGRIFLPVAIVCGLYALTISLSFPMWGASYNQWIGVAASLFMIFAFFNAFRLVRLRKFPTHREWMIRGFAVGMGVAFFRVLLDVLQAQGMAYNDAWNIVAVVSFPTMLIAGEIWIRMTRPKRSVDRPVMAGVQPQT
jgi:hypothetical protein